MKNMKINIKINENVCVVVMINFYMYGYWRFNVF